MKATAFGALVLGGLAALPLAQAQPCPGDATPRAVTTLLTVQVDDAPARPYDNAALAALPAVTLTQQQRTSASNGADSERSIRYGGPLLRDLLLNAGFGGPQDRGARPAVIEALATDGYRAVFSWGEVFNTALGDQVIVIQQQDGRALDAAAGPLALRSLGDLRPGPRHVRNLCAVRVRR